MKEKAKRERRPLSLSYTFLLSEIGYHAASVYTQIQTHARTHTRTNTHTDTHTQTHLTDHRWHQCLQTQLLRRLLTQPLLYIHFPPTLSRIPRCVLQCIAACCSVLQSVAVCCSVLQCLEVSCVFRC